jgi:hypothetical protein
MQAPSGDQTANSIGVYASVELQIIGLIVTVGNAIHLIHHKPADLLPHE